MPTSVLPTPRERERLLMSISKLTASDAWRTIDLTEAAATTGLPFEKARILALQLEEQKLIRFQGYVALDGRNETGAILRITADGVTEAWKLLTPWWWRWTWKDVYVAAIICTAISTVLSALVATGVTILLTRWLK